MRRKRRNGFSLTVFILAVAAAFLFGLKFNGYNSIAVATEVPSVQEEYIPVVKTAVVSSSNISDVYKKAKDSVVSVNTEYQSGFFNRTSSGAGSGVIFDEDDDKIYIVTNYHVIGNALSATISLDDETQVPAHYLGGDSKADIAVIYVDKKDLLLSGITGYKTCNFSDVQPEIGNEVLAIGNALGEGKSATFGIISTDIKTIIIDSTKLSVIQTDAAINPGNSGGALVNMNGEVIGINSAKIADTGVEGMGYAIPANIVCELIEKITSGDKIERPYLGIDDIREITGQLKEYYNLPSLGIYVNRVVQGSTAGEAGVISGDIITAVNGTPTLTEDEYLKKVNAIKVGETFTITVTRTERYFFNSYAEELTFNAVMKNYTTEPVF